MHTLEVQSHIKSKKISNDQELIQSDPTSCPINQKGSQALNYELSLFLSHFLFCFILYMVTESHTRAQQKCILISKVAIPRNFMTLITLWLSIALFWYVFTRSVQQKIKAPVKVNPFSVVLLSDWSGQLCTDQSISGRTSSRLYEY